MSIEKFFSSSPIKLITNLFRKRDEGCSISSQQQSGKGKQRTDMWDFPTMSMSDMLKKKTAITDLYDNKTNGYLVKGFLSQEEVEFALANLNNLDTTANGEFPRGSGHSNPKTFSMLADEKIGVSEELLDQYLAEIEQYRLTIDSIFPFGYEERLLNFFSSIESNIDVKIPVIKRGKDLKQLTTSTFRFCYPDGGGMNTHVGNMFLTIYPLFYSFLNKLMNIERQISYFVMLSKPEEGGDLVLFDALWGNFVQYDTANRSRITVGGFLAKTINNSNIYVWS
jgi:hypothetical protein